MYIDLLNGCVVLIDGMRVDGSNCVPITGWACDGADTANTHQLWHIVRA